MLGAQPSQGVPFLSGAVIYDMNGKSQMQGGKNCIFPKETNANRFFWDSHWLEIWKNPLISLYGIEWRERDYGLL